jgi:hypothetical protein
MQAFMHPDSLIICIAPSLRQSHEMMRRIKGHLRKLPIGIIKDSESSTELSNKSRILAVPSNTRTTRGFARCNLLIIDEMAYIEEEDYLGTRAFLATVPDARLILLSTPHGSRGVFADIWKNSKEDWTRIRVTSEEVSRDTGRIDPDHLRDMRLASSPDWYKMEYLAEFIDSNEFSVFSRELVMRAIDPTLKAYTFDLDDDVETFSADDDDDEEEEIKPRYHDGKMFTLD